MGYRITVDTGGTFSDFVYLNEASGEISVAKIPSTPDDPSRAILAGVELLTKSGVPPADVRYFCHGTTVGTNALLEGKGVRTGLLVTQGFRGIYEVAEQSRPYGPAIFDILYDRPKMLVPASLTGEFLRRAKHCCRWTKPRCAKLCARSARQASLLSRSAFCFRF